MPHEIHSTDWRRSILVSVLVLCCGSLQAAISSRAFALTLEQARERCRETVGRPIVQSCMHAKGFGPGSGKSGFDAEAAREACRATATPQVRACVEKMMTAAHGRANVPVALSEEKPSETTLPDQGAPVFVAPPRTIKDIAAIFDEEKPDPVKIAKLQADADGQPPNGVSRRDLAWFYYLRANARNQLGRLKEAIADIEKGLEIARGVAEPNFIGRLQQLAGRLYMTAGRPRQALALYLEHIRTTDAPGARGYIHVTSSCPKYT
jgi:hypothetical protein